MPCPWSIDEELKKKLMLDKIGPRIGRCCTVLHLSTAIVG
jgi:hypothetical protein